MERHMARMAYALILDKIYGVELPVTGTIIFTVPDYNIGLYRHYSVDFNSTFLNVQRGGRAAGADARAAGAADAQPAPH